MKIKLFTWFTKVQVEKARDPLQPKPLSLYDFVSMTQRTLPASAVLWLYENHVNGFILARTNWGIVLLLSNEVVYSKSAEGEGTSKIMAGYSQNTCLLQGKLGLPTAPCICRNLNKPMGTSIFG